MPAFPKLDYILFGIKDGFRFMPPLYLIIQTFVIEKGNKAREFIKLRAERRNFMLLVTNYWRKMSN